MACPASGNSISLLGICREKQNDDYTDTTAIQGGQGGNVVGGNGTISLESCATSGNNHSPQVVMEATNTSSPSYPNGNAPHGMAEFYSYDHDFVARVGKPVYSTSVAKGVFACNQTTDGTWYFPDTSPAVNDQVYTSATGTGTPSAGKYGYLNIGSVGDDTDYRFEVDSNGVITSVNSC